MNTADLVTAPIDAITWHRVAVYWAPPPSHALWQAGNRWLRGDGPTPLFPAQLAAAARYGFHATLKAPIRTGRAFDRDGFVAAARRLAARFEAFAMPPLTVGTLGHFVALRPALPCGDALRRLHALAETVVRELDEWRVPMDAEEYQRRAQGQDARGCELLARWGYPYVFERWRMHMTLCAPISDPRARDHALALARDWFANPLAEPLRCEALSLYVQPGPDSAFERLLDLPLAAGAEP